MSRRLSPTQRAGGTTVSIYRTYVGRFWPASFFFERRHYFILILSFEAPPQHSPTATPPYSASAQPPFAVRISSTSQRHHSGRQGIDRIGTAAEIGEKSHCIFDAGVIGNSYHPIYFTHSSTHHSTSFNHPHTSEQYCRQRSDSIAPVKR